MAATVMVPAGTLREQWEDLPGGLTRLRVQWTTNGTEAGGWLSQPLNGVLHRVVGRKPAATDAQAYLYTELGWDAFNGRCSGLYKLTGGQSEHRIFYLLDGADRPSLIAVLGEHFLRITVGAQLTGVLDLYYYTDLRYALADRTIF